jgi:hypothetical protein
LTNTQLRTLLFFFGALCAQKSNTLPWCISGAPTNHDRETLQNKESNKKALWKAHDLRNELVEELLVEGEAKVMQNRTGSS